MNALAVGFRFVSAVVGVFVLALVVVPIHLAFEALTVLGQEVARVRRNW